MQCHLVNRMEKVMPQAYKTSVLLKEKSSVGRAITATSILLLVCTNILEQKLVI